MKLKEKLELIKGVKLVKQLDKNEFEILFFFDRKESKKYNEDLEYSLMLCFDFLGFDYRVDERADSYLEVTVWK